MAGVQRRHGRHPGPVSVPCPGRIRLAARGLAVDIDPASNSTAYVRYAHLAGGVWSVEDVDTLTHVNLGEGVAYTAEYTDSAGGSNWMPLPPPGRWPSTNTTAKDTLPAAQRTYRVRYDLFAP